MALDEYNRKRDFKVTSEPPGKLKTTGAKRGHDEPRTFVIQKHAASRLHYDFRLELDGVLKSWSVPKGPSLDPKVKRLAVEVEDHPMDYGGFEGIIPKGQYGGGTVLLWDRGVWAPQGDAEKDLRRGELKFVLQGEKLSGGFALIKLKGKPNGRPGSSARAYPEDRGWLLIKEKDPAARPEAELDITTARPESVASQRTMEEIAADRSYVWHSNRERLDVAAVEGARAASLPATITPQVAHVARAVPDGDEWLHEIEIEGERLICRGEKGRMGLLDTAGDDWTKRAPAIAGAANLLPATSLILDGMLAALLPDGTTRRAALDEALRGKGPAKLTYFAFDLRFFDGHDLSGVPLEQRKELLKGLLARVAEPGPLRFADHVGGNGAAFFEGACRLGAPGVVSKRRDSVVAVAPKKKAGGGKGKKVPAKDAAWRVVRCAPVGRSPKPDR
jgi:bifunctional non-homologous end joining protein LigD